MAAQLITVAEARRRVLATVPAPAGETVSVSEALDRVLAAPVQAVAPSPPFDCSAMDGYAIRAPAARRLRITGESRAGHPATTAVAAGEAIRISTGAAIPPGADAVVRQEDVRPASEGQIELLGDVGTGANIRRAGEDMTPGALLLEPGRRLGPAELGLAVAAGLGQVTVSRRPRVAVVCTGDELRAPGESLGPGQIHNSNGPMLAALAARAGAQPLPPQRVPDDPDATHRALAAALAGSDVVLISGGVSVGPHDHVKPALAALEVREQFWGVALQPGKPTWFGTRDAHLVFGLPGNPVSAVVTFVLFVLPALAAALGCHPPGAVAVSARLATDVRRNPQREQAVRVRLERSHGELLATPTGPQGSHLLTSLLGAQALAMIPPGEGPLAAGTEVALEALPL